MATIQDCGIDPTLCRAVIRRLGGRDYLRDVALHGAGGGFPGFIYYRDTVAFFRRHRRAIADLVERMADDIGTNPLDMVAGFGCLAGHGDRSDYTDRGEPTVARRQRLQEFYPSAARCIYGGRLTDDDDRVANALAWFALEEVARALTDE